MYCILNWGIRALKIFPLVRAGTVLTNAKTNAADQRSLPMPKNRSMAFATSLFESQRLIDARYVYEEMMFIIWHSTCYHRPASAASRGSGEYIKGNDPAAV